MTFSHIEYEKVTNLSVIRLRRNGSVAALGMLKTDIKSSTAEMIRVL